MKVAIIGAGMAGMSCAYVLKQNGVEADIFERKDCVGEELDFPAIVLRIFDSPQRNPIKLLKNKYNINLTPHYDLKELIMVTSHKSYTVKGKLGYIFRRGKEEGTYLRQIADNVDLPIRFNTCVNAEDIRYLYDYVLVATGDHVTTRRMNNLTVQFDSIARIARVQGSFNTGSVKIWLNTQYSKKGFTYLVPDNGNEALLMLIANDVQYPEFEDYWNTFLSENRSEFSGIDTKNYKDLRHTAGLAKQMKIENILFAGNAAGLIDSFIGFGSLKAIFSGALAAHCMLTGEDYNLCMGSMVKDIQKKFEYRKAMNTMDDKEMDRMIAFLTAPVVKQFIYNNPFMRVTYGSLGAKLYTKLNK